MNHSQLVGARVIRFVSRSGGLAALLLAAAALLLPAAAMGEEAGTPSGNGIQPEAVSGNPKCEDYGLYELKVEPPVSGTYSDELGYLTGVKVTVKGSSAGQIFDWESASVGVDLVIAKGGKVGANLYTYDPPEEATADTGLHAPINPSGEYANLSHISFCYDIELEVSKTADTSFTREYKWNIQKSNEAAEPLILSAGQTYNVPYEVKVNVSNEIDSDWAVTGTITVHNPAPATAEGVNVTDVISDVGEVAVDCNGEAAGNGLPATIEPGGNLECTYSRPLPDGEQRTNTATATSTTDGIGEGEGAASIEFGAPSEQIDECIEVDDDLYGHLGTVCANESPKTFKYTNLVGPYDEEECGKHQVTNTASFETNDEGATGEDSSTVYIEVLCKGEGGCTLTQGYWKTHSEYGQAPYDDTWALLPGGLGADTLFFNNAESWYMVFWTAPKHGNAYLILAHQYMAAVLNGLNGADQTSAVSQAITKATLLLFAYSETHSIDEPPKGKLRKEMLELASILAAYNEGLEGIPHCSEDGTSSSSA